MTFIYASRLSQGKQIQFTNKLALCQNKINNTNLNTRPVKSCWNKQTPSRRHTMEGSICEHVWKPITTKAPLVSPLLPLRTQRRSRRKTLFFAQSCVLTSCGCPTRLHRTSHDAFRA